MANSLKGSLTLGVGLSSFALVTQAAEAAEKKEKTMEKSKEMVSKPGDMKKVSTEEEFRMGVIGPAELSLAASKMAVDKATNKNTREFAQFELTEAIAVTTVLKDLQTPVPSMDAKAKETLEKLESTEKGPAFDKAFIMAQLENHEFLRDHAADYLKNSKAKTMEEAQGRHLATLSHAVFVEHVAITTRILSELKAA